MIIFLSKLKVAYSLGIWSIFYYLKYRLILKLKVNSIFKTNRIIPKGPYFHSIKKNLNQSLIPLKLNKSFPLLFGRWTYFVPTSSPKCFFNPFTGKKSTKYKSNWWKIPDFDEEIGDIKIIWELSRMHWVVALAQRASQGKKKSLEMLNFWLDDWCLKNPMYQGPNWKCGQETSIRVINLAIAALILRQINSSEDSLLRLIEIHLERIEPTLDYAISQNNNHGTSEAAALFIGGSWLHLRGFSNGKRLENLGRKWLENRAKKLIGNCGSFSQYSLNYHRLMLDTFCITEVWRQNLNLPTFSKIWLDRMILATKWLQMMVNSFNGDGPNIGANDGAHLLQLSDKKFRDFRPSVQLAMAIFVGKSSYDSSVFKDDTLCWLNIKLPKVIEKSVSNYMADDGGYCVFKNDTMMAVMRYPRFNFRPGHADALHFDFWLGSLNILRDGGTFSYNSGIKWINYFGGVESHNTIQFDNRDQMRRLSRFLYADWLKTSYIKPLYKSENFIKFEAGYKDSYGAHHLRKIIFSKQTIEISDKISGFTNIAVLRWRLMPAKWKLKRMSNKVSLQLSEPLHFSLDIETSMDIKRLEIVKGWESKHYLEKTKIPVLELEVKDFGRIITKINWQK